VSTFASDFVDKFDARWDEVSILIKMAEELGEEDEKYGVLCRAAIVLVVANLEGFLQETIKCLIYDVNNNDAFSNTPNKMKRTFCSQFIEVDDKRNEKKITKMVELFEQTNIKYTLEPFLYENNKNPKASVIEKYFEEIGGKNFWGYITNCDIEKVFENDLLIVRNLLDKMKNILVSGVESFPYNIDISSIGYNLVGSKVTDECLWKVFLNQTLKARHDVAHGISLDNTMSVDEIKNTRDKVKILELTFAILVFKIGGGI
jgi:hypothetical protein